MNNGLSKPNCVFQETACKFELTGAARFYVKIASNDKATFSTF